MALTMVCGLATETWSRPAPRDPDGYRGWVGDPPRDERIMTLECKKRAYRSLNEQLMVYRYEDAVHILTAQKLALEDDERKLLRDYARAYTMNYVYRCAAPCPPCRLCAESLACRLQDDSSHAGLAAVHERMDRLRQRVSHVAQRPQEGGRGPLRLHPHVGSLRRVRHVRFFYLVHVTAMALPVSATL